jgi:hypothetical protein
MHETIRDYLKRRIRWTMGMAFGAWLLFPLLRAAGVDNPMVFLVAIVPLGVALISMLWVKCPRCSTRLGQSIATAVAVPMFSPQPNFCPYCGVSLDEPRRKQPAHAPQSSYNPIK